MYCSDLLLQRLVAVVVTMPMLQLPPASVEQPSEQAGVADLRQQSAGCDATLREMLFSSFKLYYIFLLSPVPTVLTFPTHFVLRAIFFQLITLAQFCFSYIFSWRQFITCHGIRSEQCHGHYCIPRIIQRRMRVTATTMHLLLYSSHVTFSVQIKVEVTCQDLFS